MPQIDNPSHQKQHADSAVIENHDLVSLYRSHANTHPAEHHAGSQSNKNNAHKSSTDAAAVDSSQGSQKTAQPDRAANAEQSIIDSLKKHPGTLDNAFSELQNLQSRETSAQFKQDLTRINADLQKSGILPGLEIITDANSKTGFSTRALDTSTAARPGSAPIPDSGNNSRADKHTERPSSIPAESGHAAHAASTHTAAGRHGGIGHGGHHARHHVASHFHVPRGFAGGAYDTVLPPNSATLQESIKAVLQEAKAQGLSEAATKAAIASMLVESKGNPLAHGDGNTSFGLFQLHRGGELTEALRQGKLQNENEAFDPGKNAHVALGYFKQLQNKYSDAGELAAASQRPKNRSEYAGLVNAFVNSGKIDTLIKDNQN